MIHRRIVFLLFMSFAIFATSYCSYRLTDSLVQARDLLAVYTDVQNNKGEMLYYQKNYLNILLEKQEQKQWTADDERREYYTLSCLRDAVIKFENSVIKYNRTSASTSSHIFGFVRWFLKKGISDSPPEGGFMEESITLKAGNKPIELNR